jgi:hypothetical protein
MTTPKKWTPQREAALARKAERGFSQAEIGPPMPNPFRRPGRPSLSGDPGESKVLTARIPRDLHERLVAVATDSGEQVSDLTRLALAMLVRTAPGVYERTDSRRRPLTDLAGVPEGATYQAVTAAPRVFVAHGRSSRRAPAIVRHLRSLGLDVVSGSADADAVVAILHGADERERTNAVFDYGMHVGRLGAERVVVVADPRTAPVPDREGPSVDLSRPRVLAALTRELARIGLVAPEGESPAATA